MSAGIVALNLVLLAIYVGFSMYWVDNSSNWWNTLKKPAWQPPDFVFGLIWPYNFLMLAISAFVIGKSASSSSQLTWTISFAVSVIDATWWGYEFYVSRVFKRAAIALTFAAVTTIPMMLTMWSVSATQFWLLIPYQLWLATAASLATGYWYLNQRD